jgi:hypothetical protein
MLGTETGNVTNKTQAEQTNQHLQHSKMDITYTSYYLSDLKKMSIELSLESLTGCFKATSAGNAEDYTTIR